MTLFRNSTRDIQSYPLAKTEALIPGAGKYMKSIVCKWVSLSIAAIALTACATPSSGPSNPAPSPPPAGSPAPPTPPSTPSTQPSGKSSQSDPSGETQGEETASTESDGQKSSEASAGKEAAQDAKTADTAGDSSAAPEGAEQVGNGAMTQEELEEAWDQEFDVALGDFDKRLAKERIEIEEQQIEGSDTGGAGDGDGFGGGSGMAGEVPPEIEGEQSVSSIDGQGGRGAPNTVARKFPAPDDVVARQLREAAETEPDPELRAKLWDEYRKYKSKGS